MKSDIAVLLPSYRRRADLEKVLKKTPLTRGKFIVVANYPKKDFEELSKKYSRVATFIDETKHGKLGVAGSYNLAFTEARERGFRYAVLFADDVLPFQNNWLEEAVNGLEHNGASMGVFSSDEGHWGSFGWNIIKDSPIAHFFIARIGDYDTFFDPRYRQYVIDFEIAVRTLREGKRIVLLPVRLMHFRSPLNRDTYGDNSIKDLDLFLKDYPEYRNYIKNHKELLIPEGPGIIIAKDWQVPENARLYPPNKNKSGLSRFIEHVKERAR